jgi:hypothetical protein
MILTPPFITENTEITEALLQIMAAATWRVFF